MANNNTTTPKKKKKPMVSLPGSLKGLVHNVQGNSNPEPVQANPEPTPAPSQREGSASEVKVEPVQASPNQEPTPSPSRGEGSANEAQKKQEQATASAAVKPESKGRSVTVESTDDSWGLFLDLAREYKEKDSHLATIYIDRDLKTVLDRLRASRDVRMPTTAILSAIVARFIYDNEKRIKDAIYGDRLI